MLRFSFLLLVLVMSTPLLAQSTVDWANLDNKSAVDLIAVAKYCAKVEGYSETQVPRIFARTISDYGRAIGWVAYDSRATWRQAGSPRPVALVWYRDAKIVRVSIFSNDDENPRVYGDYCYRKNGTLARLQSVPSVRRKCQSNGYQCTLVLRGGRWYPPEGRALTTYGVDVHLSADGGSVVEQESAGAERIVESFIPMKWPEYRNVTDLPFSELLYANLR